MAEYLQTDAERSAQIEEAEALIELSDLAYAKARQAKLDAMSDDDKETLGLLDLPKVSCPTAGIVAAGGWCAPISTWFDIKTTKLTKKKRIASQRAEIERLAAEVRKLEADNKKLRKIRKLEKELS